MATSADATGGYSTVPTVIGMRGDRRRHRVVKGAATTSERLSVAGLHDLVERLVYLPAVDLLVTCEPLTILLSGESGTRARGATAAE